jgi:hypothetical protein
MLPAAARDNQGLITADPVDTVPITKRPRMPPIDHETKVARKGSMPGRWRSSRYAQNDLTQILTKRTSG